MIGNKRLRMQVLATIAVTLVSLSLPGAQADGLDDALDTLSVTISESDGGTNRPETADTVGDWTLVPSGLQPVQASMQDVEILQGCMEDSSGPQCASVAACMSVQECLDFASGIVCEVIENLDQGQAATTECSFDPLSSCTGVTSTLCLKQADKGKIYETTQWRLVKDDVEGEAPRADAGDDGTAVAVTCTAAAIADPVAGGACYAGGLLLMNLKAGNGDYTDTRHWSGYYETTWTGFGWGDPAMATGDPTDGSISSTAITIGTPPVRCPFEAAGDEKAYKAAKTKAKADCMAASLKFAPLTGDASASVTYHILLGLLELHASSSGRGAVTLDGDANVDLGFAGEASVSELDLFGLVSWHLSFEAAGEASTPATAVEAV